jgi:hypothetical protein
MTNIILAGYVAMVVLFVIGVIWTMNARQFGKTEIPERGDRRRFQREFERSRRASSKA